MKKLIPLFVLALLILTNCGRKKHSAKKESGERIEIVPFYRNTEMTQDLHQIDTNQFFVEPEEFLNKLQYETLKNAVWSMVRNPKSKVYHSADELADAKDLKDRFAYCDSVIESGFDAAGNETITKGFRCDSTSVTNNLSRIEFYESWYLNTKTNLIEKETMGFAVWQYVKDKEAYREIFLVFRDEKAREKCKRYYFSD